MSEYQQEIWQSMINLINDYYNAKIPYCTMVTQIESALYIAKMDNNHIIDKWYELWEPLEIINAIDLDKGIETKLEDVKDKVEKMRKFLVKASEKVKQL